MATRSSSRPTAAQGSTTVVLWGLIALFWTRVIGQIEALLLQPAWLPPMEAWYSGWLPYPILLPLQILLLMLMSVTVTRVSNGGIASPATATGLRVFALVYFAAMAVRLGLTIGAHGPDWYQHGAIPVAFHWVLALFILVCARAARGHSQ